MHQLSEIVCTPSPSVLRSHCMTCSEELRMEVEHDLRERKTRVGLYAIIPTLFPCFLLICYPYILLQF